MFDDSCLYRVNNRHDKERTNQNKDRVEKHLYWANQYHYFGKPILRMGNVVRENESPRLEAFLLSDKLEQKKKEKPSISRSQIGAAPLTHRN